MRDSTEIEELRLDTELKTRCPFEDCQSITSSGKVKPKFYVNEGKGTYFCQHCRRGGRTESLDKLDLEHAVEVEIAEFDITAYGALDNTLPEEASKYIENRFPGYDVQEIQSISHLRYCPARNSIALPGFNLEGDLVSIKYRSTDPHSTMRWTSEAGSQSGTYFLGGEINDLVIVEGQMDAIAVKLLGFPGYVLALETTHLREMVARQLDKFDTIFLMLDNDNAGRAGAQDIINKYLHLDFDKIELPEDVKDLSELLSISHKRARGFVDENLRSPIAKKIITLDRHVNDVLYWLGDKEKLLGISTGYSNLDKALGGGLVTRGMTVVNALMKCGKTTLINNLALNYALQGIKVGIMSFEMHPYLDLYPAFLSMVAKQNIRELSKEDLEEVVPEFIKRNPALNNIIVFDNMGRCGWDVIRKWCDYVRAEHKPRFIFIDHAHIMINGSHDAGKNEELAQCIREYGDQHDIGMVVVVQGPKPRIDNKGKVQGAEYFGGYGGGAWGKASYSFMQMSVPDDFENVTKITHYRGKNTNGKHQEEVYLHFNPVSGRLTEEL